MHYTFVIFVDGLGKYLVSRVKDERTNLYKEIEELSALVDPIHIDDREQRIECWVYEIPELHVSLVWEVPIRGFKKEYKLVSGEKVYTKEETFHCMTTLPEEMADADIVRRIVHAKWGIENNGIKELKVSIRLRLLNPRDKWYMEHNFHHHPNATPAFARAGSLGYFIAYNLFYAYVFRHIYRLYQLTMKMIAAEMYASYLFWKWRMSWKWFDDKT